MTKREMVKIRNVGELRKLLSQLPDTAPIYIDWAGSPPSDHEPGVKVPGFAVDIGRWPDGEPIDDSGIQGLVVLVDIFYLDEIEDGDEDEEEE